MRHYIQRAKDDEGHPNYQNLRRATKSLLVDVDINAYQDRKLGPFVGRGLSFLHDLVSFSAMQQATEEMRGNEGEAPSTLRIDVAHEDPTQIFIPGPIISDEDEFGTLISASVAEEFVSELGVSLVSIRILPVSSRHAAALRKVVGQISTAVESTAVLKYIGVWEVSQSETWLVSERRRNVSLSSLLKRVWSSDAESLIAYIALQTLRALKNLHRLRQCHTNLRPENIYLNESGEVCLGEVGIYHVLRESMASRRALPGIKLWPLERDTETPMGRYNADIWDLGMSLLVVMDGGGAVARMWRSGRRFPKLNISSKWSVQCNSFMGALFSRSADSLPRLEELLNHRFVTGASPTACRVAMEEYMSKGEELISGHCMHDTISTLFRQNTAVVQAPLISIDDLSSDQFSFEQWSIRDQNRPTAEMSLLRVLRNIKEQPLPKGIEEYKSLSDTVETLEMFMETAYMQ